MKPLPSLSLMGAGAIAIAAIAFSQPSFAQAARQTITIKDDKGNVIVPQVINSTESAEQTSGNTCAPNTPCNRPVQTPSHPVSGCTPAPGISCHPTPVATPPQVICIPGGAVPCAAPVVKPVLMGKDYFFCAAGRHGIPTTFVNTPQGNVPLIRWVSEFFTGSGYDPVTRCQEVSVRFNRFYSEGRLNFVTTGIVNRQPVVCVASEIGGPCTGVLFTLKPHQDASRTIQQLFDVRAGASGPLRESESRIYIDMSQYTAGLR